MEKVSTVTRNGVVEGIRSLGHFCIISAIRGIVLMAGSMGSLVVVVAWLLLLVFPIFLFVSFMLKLLGF